jgi:hypothetical protein
MELSHFGVIEKAQSGRATNVLLASEIKEQCMIVCINVFEKITLIDPL